MATLPSMAAQIDVRSNAAIHVGCVTVTQSPFSSTGKINTPLPFEPAPILLQSPYLDVIFHPTACSFRLTRSAIDRTCMHSVCSSRKGTSQNQHVDQGNDVFRKRPAVSEFISLK